MTKIKLVGGAVLNATNVELVGGVLKITVVDGTVEELAKIFSDKTNTSKIVFMTENNIESGYKVGFTSFAGIMYDANGNKIIELFQPADVTEARISIAEGAAHRATTDAGFAINLANVAKEEVQSASKVADDANTKTLELEEQSAMMAETLDSILTDIIPSLSLQQEV